MTKENKLSRKAKKVAKANKPSGQKTKIANLTIGDVLKKSEYQKELQNILNELKRIREEAAAKSKPKRHPIDELMARGKWNAGDITVMYAEVRDKVSGEPASVRKFIDDVGTEAFNKTMKKLIEYEKKADYGNGNN